MVFKELWFCSQTFPMMYDNHDFNQVDSFIPFAVLGFYSNNGALTSYVELKRICTLMCSHKAACEMSGTMTETLSPGI
jgi:hypothetical protein